MTTNAYLGIEYLAIHCLAFNNSVDPGVKNSSTFCNHHCQQRIHSYGYVLWKINLHILPLYPIPRSPSLRLPLLRLRLVAKARNEDGRVCQQAKLRKRQSIFAH